MKTMQMGRLISGWVKIQDGDSQDHGRVVKDKCQWLRLKKRLVSKFSLKTSVLKNLINLKFLHPLPLNKFRCRLKFRTLNKFLLQMLHLFMSTKKMSLLMGTPLFHKLIKFPNHLCNSIKQVLQLNSNIRFLKDTNNSILNLKLATLNNN